MANWVDLPKDVLERIFNSCFVPDQIRMQSVCKSWRSILMYGIHRKLPWLMTLPNNNYNKEEEEEEEDPPPDSRLFYSLSKQEIHTGHMKRGMERILELKNAGSASPSDNHAIKVEKVKQ